MQDDIRITVIATGFDERREKLVSADSPSAGMDVFTAKRPMFKSTLFTKKQVETLAEEAAVEDKHNTFTKRPVGEDTMINHAVPPPAIQSRLAPTNGNGNTSEHDELEIPAFIRKKMGM
jgi:hypothetical protein